MTSLTFLFFSIFSLSSWGLANKIFNFQKKTKPGRNFRNWNEKYVLRSRSSFDFQISDQNGQRLEPLSDRIGANATPFWAAHPLWLILNWRGGFWLRGHEGERNNCFIKILLVGQKYRDKTTLASKTWFSRHCFGFQSRRSSLIVGYNI